ncbi:MAG: hypothetical protein K2X77_25500 [Candidatus Obscuribacterales bacterium]|jgi:DNA mismatch repair ATPase MutL|nr:hypothetical protein [Candidatus Obscuribacterales bacterium]
MPSDKHVPEEKVEQVQERDSSTERAPQDLSASLWQAKSDSARPTDSSRSTTQAPSLEIVDEKKTEKSNTTAPTEVAAASSDQKLTPRKLSDKAEKTPNPEELKEANESLFKAATESLNTTSIWQLPKYIRGIPKATPDLACVSTFSALFRKAMENEGVIASDKDAAHRKYYQVNMDELFNKMVPDNLLRKIDPSEVRAGDIIVGRRPGTTSRHLGVVGQVENGELQTYHNDGGRLIQQSANERFYKRYPQVEYYRAYLPAKK